MRPKPILTNSLLAAVIATAPFSFAFSLLLVIGCIDVPQPPGPGPFPPPQPTGDIARECMVDYSHRLADASRTLADRVARGDIRSQKQLTDAYSKLRESASSDAFRPWNQVWNERLGEQWDAATAAELLREEARQLETIE